MDYIDYYKVLELDKNCTPADIRKAYRRLARKYHPDLNPNDKNAKANFQKINEANEVLSDPEKRMKYDQFGGDWQHAEQYQQAAGDQRRQRRPDAGSYQPSGFEDHDFSDFFESMFGAGRTSGRRSQARFKGQDFSATLELDIRDAFQTHKRTLTVNGKNIRLTIPAGVEDGQTIKIAGHGAEGENGGPNGDLYLTFAIQNNTPFVRNGENLYKTEKIDLYSAVLGGEVMVETFDNPVKLSLKPGTQGGTKVRLKGKGFPVYRKEGQSGDLIITFQVQTPVNLTEKEKALFSELQKLSGYGK